MHGFGVDRKSLTSGVRRLVGSVKENHMTGFKRLGGVAAALAGSALLFAGPAHAAFDLNGIGFVQYGDAQSYSLPIAELQDGCTGPGCQFYVNSTPGAIKGLTVIGTGAGGSDVLNNFSGMDNAYSTPNGTINSPANPYWNPSPATSNGTNGVVNNNGANTWDSSLLALKTYLGSEQMIFFFNNNQENSNGTAAQSLAAWARITVRDAGGAVVGSFDLTNRSQGTGNAMGKYNLVTAGGGGTFGGDVHTYNAAANSSFYGPNDVALGTNGHPFAGTKDQTEYVLSGGAVCVTTNTAVPIPVPCDASNPNVSKPINHNLGANQAAYAILFPELNDLISSLFGSNSDATLALYTMSVDVRLGCDPSLDPATQVCLGLDGNPIEYGRNLNNGYEQIFISKASDVVNVPEPGTLALAGLVLLGLALSRRRT